MRLYAALFVFALLLPLQAQADALTYQRPPEPIASLLAAEGPPSLQLSPDRRFLLLTHREPMPGIEVVAAPYLKLAGQRFDPVTRGPKLGTQVTKLVLRTLADGSERTIDLRGHLDGPVWSADGNRLAFARAASGGAELCLVDAGSGVVRVVPGVRLNRLFGGSMQWLADQRTLLVLTVPPGEPPPTPIAPAGPNVQATTGKTATVRTYQDLLGDEHDAQLFEFYGQSQMQTVDATTGAATQLGTPGLYTAVQDSPDARFLLVTTLRRPFSYLVPWRQFPEAVVVLDRDGRLLRRLHEHGLQDTTPIGGVPTGPRGIRWLPQQPHTLVWYEALDGGDPKAKVTARDAIVVLTEPAGEPRRWLTTEHRASGLQFGGDGRLALLTEFDRELRRERVWRLDAGDFAAPGRQLYERSTQDAYGDPGRPIGETMPNGQTLLRQRGETLFLSGAGASRQGNRPFVDAWDLGTGQKRRLFECAPDRLENFAGFLDADGARLLIASESPTEPRNYFAVDPASGARTALTAFTDPAQQYIARIEKQLLRYQRADGVALSGTLYLPPDAPKDKPLPCFVWAYPLEYVQASDAGQVRSSPNAYVRLSPLSPLWLLFAGYAVFDDAAMPIVGPSRTANDSYVEQLVANAEAARDALRATGRVDVERLAVGGHSYGAFMTANLLAHSDVFAAGIARSGAYNRTLTPFGFQSEERTFWEAPQLYLDMSPFAHADRIDEPLLLIHGADDNNPGTFPIQSPRLFMAMQGHGGTARLCMLPHESHGYAARQSVEHCLWEMLTWLDQHVKHRRTAVVASAAQPSLPSETVRYEVDGTTFEGTIVHHGKATPPRPGVLMVPNWMGPGAEALDECRRLAAMGYVVMMVDMYGVDTRPQDSKAAGAAAGLVRADRGLMRARAQQALAVFRERGKGLGLDPAHVAAIGFCFGGGTVLELGRSGAELDAIVSFHGDLGSPTLVADAGKTKAKVLVCHGAADPYVPQADVQAFVAAYGATTVDWQLLQLAGAVHSFTDRAAASDGARYHERSSQRAFAAMRALFDSLWSR